MKNKYGANMNRNIKTMWAIKIQTKWLNYGKMEYEMN